MENENTPEVTPEAVEAGLAPEVPAFLRDVDPAKRDEVLRKLGLIKETREQQMADAVPAEQAAAEQPKPEPQVMSGKDVDWTEYDLDYSVKHLYNDARFQMTPQGPKWVAMVDEFNSSERSWGNFDTKVKDRNGNPDAEFLNLGQYLNDMLNGPEGWNLISVLPGSTGRAGVLLRRTVPILLPDPKQLEKETTVEAPKDEELQKVQDAGDMFAAEIGVVAEGDPQS